MGWGGRRVEPRACVACLGPGHLPSGSAVIPAHGCAGPWLDEEAEGRLLQRYDPRVIEVTGISMMVTAQGADHTTGNAPKYDCTGKSLDDLVKVSLDTQILCAAQDSLGLCIFGRSVTNINTDFVTTAINDALGTNLPMSFFQDMGRATLKLEAEFNLAAGFTEADDELPKFFYDEALEPSFKTARFHTREVNEAVRRWWDSQPVANAS